MIVLTIVCDGCGLPWVGERVYGVGWGGVMRLRAADAGWTAPPHSGKDYCPSCRRVQGDESQSRDGLRDSGRR